MISSPPGTTPYGKHWFLRYVLLFLLISSVLYALFVTHFDALLPYFTILAKGVRGLLGLFFKDITSERNVIIHPRFALEITRGCDGTTSLILLLAAVLPFPVGLKPKLVALAAAVPIVLVFNYARIVALVLTKMYYPSIFTTMHVYILQPFMVLLTFALFAVWLIVYAKHPQ